MAKIIRPKGAVKINDDLLERLSYGEEVKPVRNVEHYFVTNMGRVFSAKKIIRYTTIKNTNWYCVVWTELKPRIVRGYKVVNLIDKGQRKTEYVHKLVYEAFHGYVDRRVLKIVHRDKDKLNNNINNLAITWKNRRDYDEHMSYAYRQYMIKGIDKNLKKY